MVTDRTAEEKKIPRSQAAAGPARLSASASASAITVSGGTIINVDDEGVDQRLVEDRIGREPRVIVEADEVPGPEQLDPVEAEPHPAKQRKDQDDEVKRKERRDEQQPLPPPARRHAACLWKPVPSGPNRCAAAPSIIRPTSSPTLRLLIPLSSPVTGKPSFSRA